MARRRQTWRAAPLTLAVVITFGVISVVVIPMLAYLIYQRTHDYVLPAVLLVLTVLVVLYAWRFGLHPRIVAEERGVRVVNPFRRARFDWEDITVVFPGENGLVIASPRLRTEAWCVQKSNTATRRGRHTRADAVAADLLQLADAHDNDPDSADTDGPDDDSPDDGTRIRRARPDEVRRLARMERAASEAALEHIFPPEDYPYPSDEIARRWRRLLRHPRVQVRVLDVDDAPVGYLAYDEERVRHLGIVPQQSGRGYGSQLLEFACQEIFAAGARQSTLWVLVDNTQAREFYRARGWIETEDRRECEFPPYPPEMRMVRRNPSVPRRGR
jgi:ribosomal protein S18 acetylase RimI-like enzyme